jgi:hypothetical protein
MELCIPSRLAVTLSEVGHGFGSQLIEDAAKDPSTHPKMMVPV